MAAQYGFNEGQKQQLAELLAQDSSMWARCFIHVHSHIIAHVHHHIAVGVYCHIIGNGIRKIAVVIVEEMLAHKYSSSIFNNLVFHTGAFDSEGVETRAVRFPVREVNCFFLVGITMANDDIFRDIAAAGGKRAADYGNLIVGFTAFYFS